MVSVDTFVSVYSKAIDVDDRVGECLWGFRRQVVTDAAAWASVEPGAVSGTVHWRPTDTKV
jgi:hypothetical protein